MSRHSGFTMMELLIVIGIVGIVAAVGASSFKYVTASNRIASEINALLADMRYARSEAIRQGLPVTVCPTTNNTSCSSSSPSWQSGWMVFSDPTGTQTLATGSQPLRTQAAFSTAYSNSTDAFVLSAAGFFAETFNRQGFGAAYLSSTTTSATTVTMALKTSPANANWTRCLAITRVGQLSIETTATSSCQSL